MYVTMVRKRRGAEDLLSVMHLESGGGLSGKAWHFPKEAVEAVEADQGQSSKPVLAH